MERVIIASVIMKSVTYGKCYLWQMYYGKCNYGKNIYGKNLMANETEPVNHDSGRRKKFLKISRSKSQFIQFFSVDWNNFYVKTNS